MTWKSIYSGSETQADTPQKPAEGTLKLSPQVCLRELWANTWLFSCQQKHQAICRLGGGNPVAFPSSESQAPPPHRVWLRKAPAIPTGQVGAPGPMWMDTYTRTPQPAVQSVKLVKYVKWGLDCLGELPQFQGGP